MPSLPIATCSCAQSRNSSVQSMDSHAPAPFPPSSIGHESHLNTMISGGSGQSIRAPLLLHPVLSHFARIVSRHVCWPVLYLPRATPVHSCVPPLLCTRTLLNQHHAPTYPRSQRWQTRVPRSRLSLNHPTESDPPSLPCARTKHSV